MDRIGIKVSPSRAPRLEISCLFERYTVNVGQFRFTMYILDTFPFRPPQIYKNSTKKDAQEENNN